MWFDHGDRVKHTPAGTETASMEVVCTSHYVVMCCVDLLSFVQIVVVYY